MEKNIANSGTDKNKVEKIKKLHFYLKLIILNTFGEKNSERKTSSCSIFAVIVFLILIFGEIIMIFVKNYLKFYGFSGEDLIEAIKDSVILPIFIPYFGFLTIIEYVIKIKEEKIKRRFARVVFSISIMLLIITIASCSNLNAQSIPDFEAPRSSVIMDYQLSNFHYQIEMELLLQIDEYVSLSKRDKIEIKKIIQYINKLRENRYLERGRKKLPSKIEEKENNLKTIQEIINRTADNYTKQKLYRLYVVFSLVLIDTYCRNRTIFDEIDTTRYEFNYSQKLSDILDWISNCPRIQSDTLKENRLYLGSIENMKGVVNALYRAPVRPIEERKKIAQKIEVIYDSLMVCTNILNKMVIDALFCDRAFNDVKTWKNSNELCIRENRTQFERMDIKYRNVIGIDDSLQIVLGLGETSSYLDALERKIEKCDSLIKINFQAEKEKYDPFILKMKDVRKDIIISLLSKQIDTNEAISNLLFVADTVYNMPYNKVVVDSMVLSINKKSHELNKKVERKKIDYDYCASIFNKSYNHFQNISITRDSTYKNFDLLCIPLINIFIAGLNWDIPINENIEKIPSDMHEAILNDLSGLIDEYRASKRAEMDNLIRKIEGMRFYFNYGSVDLTNMSDNILTELLFDIQRLRELAAYFNEKINIQIHGHNGATRERFSNLVQVNINQRPLEVIAAWIAVRRSDFIYQLLTDYKMNKYFSTYRVQEYNKAVEYFDKEGKLNATLSNIINQVKPFEVLEQSTTFQVVITPNE